jgi:KDO2-lipid IV(A) lauroyltransferase
VRRRTDLLAYVAMRAAIGAMRPLPRGLALDVGTAMGRFARSPLGLRRAVADANIARAFPDLPQAARDAISRGVFGHFGRMMVESLRVAATGGREVLPLVRAGDAPALVRDLLARGRGLLVLTGHIGNWEVAAAFLAAQGVPVTTVWKPQANPRVAGYLDELRRRLAVDAIPMPEARTGVRAALEAGKLVALVADQAPLRGSTWVPFFGQPTRTYEGPGHFAAQTGAPVVFGGMLEDGAGGYRAFAEVLDEAPQGTADQLVPRIATLYRARLEALVRTAPEQYLWTHRLWKTPPPSGP